MAETDRTTVIARVENASQAVREAARRGQVVFRKEGGFSGVKVFSTTIYDEPDELVAIATVWIAEHDELEVVDITVTHSAIVIAYRRAG